MHIDGRMGWDYAQNKYIHLKQVFLDVRRKYTGVLMYIM